MTLLKDTAQLLCRENKGVFEIHSIFLRWWQGENLYFRLQFIETVCATLRDERLAITEVPHLVSAIQIFDFTFSINLLDTFVLRNPDGSLGEIDTDIFPSYLIFCLQQMCHEENKYTHLAIFNTMRTVRCDSIFRSLRRLLMHCISRSGGLVHSITWPNSSSTTRRKFVRYAAELNLPAISSHLLEFGVKHADSEAIGTFWLVKPSIVRNSSCLANCLQQRTAHISCGSSHALYAIMTLLGEARNLMTLHISVNSTI